MDQKKIIIVGAGASGLMAAIASAEEGASVTVLEQNEKPGKKLLSTGNGRCNFTNTEQSPECYRGTDPGFALPALYSFGQQDTVRFFSRLGIYSVNRGGYLYPRSGQASQVLSVLLMEAKHRGIRIRCATGVLGIEKKGSGFLVQTEGYAYPCDAVILANGSIAAVNASSGTDGYTLAKSLGHTVIDPCPALVPLVTAEKYPWQGVRAEGQISLRVDGETVSVSRGELQLTSYGISGIPVFQVSRFAARAVEEGRRVTAEIDFFPDFDDAGFESFMDSRRKACPYKNDQELLEGLFPDKLIPVLLSGKDAVTAVKHFPLTIKGTRGFDAAQVCSGGVDTSEVDPFTMRSLLVPGLYFCGEILDIDGMCGGYNLQWAWSSGETAGRNAAAYNQP